MIKYKSTTGMICKLRINKRSVKHGACILGATAGVYQAGVSPGFQSQNFYFISSYSEGLLVRS